MNMDQLEQQINEQNIKVTKLRAEFRKLKADIAKEATRLRQMQTGYSLFMGRTGAPRPKKKVETKIPPAPKFKQEVKNVL
jgi:TolA-binding protein